MIKNLFIFIFTVSIAIACSFKNPKDLSGSIKISLKEEKSQAPILTDLLQSYLAPSSISDFNCFAINVTGAGIVPNNDLNDCVVLSGNMNGVGIGITSEIVPKTSTISAEIPAGLNRRIDVYGIYPRTISSCSNDDTIPSITNGFYVGGVSADIQGSTSLTIPISFTSSQTPSVSCGINPTLRFGYAAAGHKIYEGVMATPTPAATCTAGSNCNYVDPTATPAPYSAANNNSDSLDYCVLNTHYPYPAFVDFWFNVTNFLPLTDFNRVDFYFAGSIGYDTDSTDCSLISSLGGGITFGLSPNGVFEATPVSFSSGQTAITKNSPSSFEVQSGGKSYIIVRVFANGAASYTSKVLTKAAFLKLIK